MIGFVRENLHRMRGSLRYQRFHELQAMQNLPLEELQKRQFAQLSELLRYAYDTVPYYRRSFGDLGITPEDIRSLADFSRLPVLSRQSIQDNLADLVSSACPEDKRSLNASGGTTGKPVSVYQDSSMREEMEASFLFAFSFAGWQPSDMIVTVWGNPKDNAPASAGKKIKSWLGGVRRLNGYQYGKKEIQYWLETIGSYRRVFIYGYVSVLTDVADYILSTNATVNNVHGILTSAERLHPHQRELISKAFGCRVYDQYGCREVPGIATECSEGNMHLLTSSAYTEFLPLKENPGLPLEKFEEELPQRIILTGFHNYAMPLIRYENGDMGRPKDGVCSCGRGLPLMQMDIGRIGSSLRLLDGTRLYSSVFVHQVSKTVGINAFQFRQTAADEVQLYIVRGTGFTDEGDKQLRDVVTRFPQSVCPGIRLNLHYVDDVPRTSAGKHRQVICEID